MSTNDKQDETAKRGPLDSLDREELIKKCKQLLTIAKNAKQAKDDLYTDNQNLEKSIQQLETKIANDKQCLSAMQEIIDSQTEKELAAKTDVDKLQHSYNMVSEQLHTLTNQSIENESMKRQIKRLTDENDELMKDLQNSEKQLQTVTEASIQQNKDLHVLEETTSKWTKLELLYQDLTIKYNNISTENIHLKQDACENAEKQENAIVHMREKLNIVEQELQDKQCLIENFEHLINQEKSTANEMEKMKLELNDKITLCKELEIKLLANETQSNNEQDGTRNIESLKKQLKNQSKKLNLYKTKVIEFSAQLKQLRMGKDILSKTVNEYSNDVAKWQLEIVTVSNRLFEKIQQLQTERNSTIEKNELLIEANEQLQQNINKYNNQLVELTNNIQIYKEFEDKYNRMYDDHQKLIQTIEEQNNAIKTLSVDSEIVDNLKKENAILVEKQINFDKENKQLKKDLNEMDAHVKELDEELCLSRDQLQKSIDKLQEITKENNTNINNYLEEKEEKEQLAALENDLSDKIAIIKSLECQNEQHQQEIKNLKLSFEEQLQNKSNDVQCKTQEIDDILQRKAKETDELLCEMRELNEVLKNRGDIITKQNDKIGAMESASNEFNEKLRNLESLCNGKNAEISRLSVVISDFEKASVINDQFSTSSISKAEEITRMRDIDDSFEEKYNKLRGFAVKLKKKVAEQSAIIVKLESKQNQHSDEGVQITTKLGAIEMQVKNLQLLQSENDNLQDRIDALSLDKRNAEKIVDELKTEIAKLSRELSEEKTDNSNSKTIILENGKIKLALEQAIKEYGKQIQGLKTDCNSNGIVIKELEIQLGKLKDENTLKDKEIVALKEDGNRTKAELNKVKSSVKSKNVLNLEMEAYEKSLNETSQKLENKLAQITDLELTIKNSESSNEALKNQIKILENNLESEQQHAMELKQQIDIQQSKLKECEYDKSNLITSINEHTRQHEQIKIELENVRLNAEQMTIDREKIVQILQMENEKNARQISAQNNESAQLKIQLREAEQELIDVKTEYASYKVRAQLVLRQNKSNETSRETELEDELMALRSYLENTQTKLTAVTLQKDQLHIDYDEIKQDKERLQLKCKELLELIDESRAQIESVHIDVEQQNVNHQESLKAQRLQIDTLNNFYKKVIIELDESYRKDLDEFKAKIQIKNVDNALVKTHGNSPLSENNQQNVVQFIKPLSTDEQKIEWILTERQEGEGSENTTTSGGYAVHRKISTTSTTSRNRRDFIPLDELLNNSFEDNNTTFVEPPISPSIELQVTKDKLNLHESRVKHLTALLAETEQDLAKLTQLNDVLKEEMRRNERSTEREKHLHNLEYLKNVVFKFLTINNGDEKLHLVPVLNTILKLSPDETQKLQCFARGDNNTSWGNYLPKWNNN